MKRIHLIKTITLVLAAAMLLTLAGCGGYNTQKGDRYGEKAMDQIEKYLKKPADFPFSFKYGKTKVTGFGEGFEKISENRSKTADGTVFNVRFLHSASGAVFEVQAKAYAAFDAYEWTVFITNESDKKTARFSEINAADIVFKGSKPVLKGINGDLGDMYAPYEVDLRKEAVVKSSTSGRPTHGSFPYFNLNCGSGGVLIAVGWPGCWKASFDATDGKGTHFTAGQYEISVALEPGESVRTPLVAFLRHEGRDDTAGMNLWRRWFIECNMRKDSSGNVISPVLGWGSVVQGHTTHSLTRTYNAFLRHNITLDYLWLDAGWYVNADGNSCGWPETGMWQVDTVKFPDKLAEVSELVHKNGGKTLLWFESEVVRCDKKKFLEANKDFKEEWFLGVAAPGSWLEGQLVDLGNPEARDWLIKKITNVMEEGGIDMYRQDFNVDPAEVWKWCDDYDKTGYTENRYVTGYLAFWDSLLELYPDMTIDSCASGGGRNDLETMRRSVPLHISDYWDGQTGRYDERQALLLSLSQWFPYFKLQIGGSDEINDYNLRSCMAPWNNMNVPTMSKSTPWDIVTKAVKEWRALSKYFYKDFYPLTAYSSGDDVWRAYEYYDEEAGEGAVMVFRAANNAESEKVLKLHADTSAKYIVKDCDGKLAGLFSGFELENGLKITLEEPGTSTLIFISKANG
ncbi:MAG: alpha-galactosidase [Clostridia bacterium]|nr:alpha-galactosidase [Clostridia bacterium]